MQRNAAILEKAGPEIAVQPAFRKETKVEANLSHDNLAPEAKALEIFFLKGNAEGWPLWLYGTRESLPLALMAGLSSLATHDAALASDRPLLQKVMDHRPQNADAAAPLLFLLLPPLMDEKNPEAATYFQTLSGAKGWLAAPRGGAHWRRALNHAEGGAPEWRAAFLPVPEDWQTLAAETPAAGLRDFLLAMKRWNREWRSLLLMALAESMEDMSAQTELRRLLAASRPIAPAITAMLRGLSGMQRRKPETPQSNLPRQRRFKARRFWAQHQMRQRRAQRRAHFSRTLLLKRPKKTNAARVANRKNYRARRAAFRLLSSAPSQILRTARHKIFRVLARRLSSSPALLTTTSLSKFSIPPKIAPPKITLPTIAAKSSRAKQPPAQKTQSSPQQNAAWLRLQLAVKRLSQEFLAAPHPKTSLPLSPFLRQRLITHLAALPQANGTRLSSSPSATTAVSEHRLPLYPASLSATGAPAGAPPGTPPGTPTGPSTAFLALPPARIAAASSSVPAISTASLATTHMKRTETHQAHLNRQNPKPDPSPREKGDRPVLISHKTVSAPAIRQNTYPDEGQGAKFHSVLSKNQNLPEKPVGGREENLLDQLAAELTAETKETTAARAQIKDEMCGPAMPKTTEAGAVSGSSAPKATSSNAATPAAPVAVAVRASAPTADLS